MESYDGWTVDELKKELAYLGDEMTDIRKQVDDAKSLAASTGQYGDREWFLRANDALRIKGQQHQRICMALGRLRDKAKQENIARKLTATEHFKQLVFERVGPVDFANMWREAKSRSGEVSAG